MSQASSFRLSPTSTLPSSPPPLATSPTRARSTSDLFSEHEKAKSRTSIERKLSNARSVTSLVASNSLQPPSVSSPHPVKGDTLNGLEDDDRPKEKEPWVLFFCTTLLSIEPVAEKSIGPIRHSGRAPRQAFISCSQRRWSVPEDDTVVSLLTLIFRSNFHCASLTHLSEICQPSKYFAGYAEAHATT
jgi:hypothetical protein